MIRQTKRADLGILCGKTRLLAAMVILLAAITIYLMRSGSTYIEPPHEQWYLSDDTKFNVNIGWHEMWGEYNSIPNRHKHTVQVAVIDTGVDADNSEIRECVIEREGASKDELGHGTKVAGIICASQYEGCVIGVSDIKRTRIFPISIIPEDCNYSDNWCGADDLTDAIKLADFLGCKICNISLNTDAETQSLKDAISESEMLFVVSAGNGSGRGRNIDKKPSYPASYNFDNLITVTNIKSNGRLNTNANYGQCVDVAAPGTEIYNIELDNRYGTSTGTSFAVPIVTGLASMLYICDETMTAAQCKDIILRSASQERRLNNKIENNRVVNLSAALKCVAN